MNHYAQATLYVNKSGTSLGVSQKRFVVKKRKKVLFFIPQDACERVIVAAKNISISSNFITTCAKRGIAIDFIDKKEQKHLALLSSTKSAYPKMTQLQLELQTTPQRVLLAREFLRAKSKNQINYLRYLNKYHQRFDHAILQMRMAQKRLLTQNDTILALMGTEGEISRIYWGALASMLKGKVDFYARETRGAKDIVNASLNYAYAILYGRIHHHALKAGLSLHLSFLHSSQPAKPTLVFDMIEEFRTFVVDRVVFRMFNQNEPLKLQQDGRLDPFSQKRIAQKIVTRLYAKTRYKNSTKEIDHIIEAQAYLLARTIKGKAHYRAFVGRY